MALGNITVKKSDNTDLNFIKLSTGSGGSEWIDDGGGTAGTHYGIKLRYKNASGKSVSKGFPKPKIATVTIYRVEHNATLGKQEKFNMSLNITYDPGATLISTAEMRDCLAFLSHFMTGCQITAPTWNGLTYVLRSEL